MEKNGKVRVGGSDVIRYDTSADYLLLARQVACCSLGFAGAETTAATLPMR